MTLHIVREIEKLKKRLLTLSAMVEESYQRSIAALERRDARPGVSRSSTPTRMSTRWRSIWRRSASRCWPCISR